MPARRFICTILHTVRSHLYVLTKNRLGAKLHIDSMLTCSVPCQNEVIVNEVKKKDKKQTSNREEEACDR